MRKSLLTIWLATGLASAFCGEIKSAAIYSVSLDQGSRHPLQKLELPGSLSEPVQWGNDVHLFPSMRFQAMAGIGGAFNEIGAEAIHSLNAEKRQELLEALFGKEGAAFSLCRTPVGASDFAFDAYGFAEVPDDYALKHFSIARDKQHLIPYLRAALKTNPDLKLIASPWSPPGWMKVSGSMVGTERQGARLRASAKIYSAYAEYFRKYLESYAGEGVPIHALFIQNEVDVVAPYPSCLMPWDEMKTFVGTYLEPLFKQHSVPTRIGYGTFRGIQEAGIYEAISDQAGRARPALFGVQYMPNRMLLEARMRDPKAEIMHTEGTCYDGANSAEQATSRFGEAAQYINGGAVNFCYWNMVLNEKRTSGWGWQQNSLVVVDRQSGEVNYMPDYNALFLLSRFIRPGDVRIGALSVNQPDAIAVIDAAGVIKVIVQNARTAVQTYVLRVGERDLSVNLPARSLVAIEWNPAH